MPVKNNNKQKYTKDWDGAIRMVQMCWATAILKLFWDGVGTVLFGKLFQSGIVLGNKLNLNHSVINMKGGGNNW